ncbi:poly [ADP-ribose] [Lates japonicus]|uniref:Poly [ADP-ribose] n=1 Tax=Lates japonicus TaxID=270547 RepID=A0AAD3NER9_LATJO|nr:poly [ADP-ribose] [Lates japonicus]
MADAYSYPLLVELEENNIPRLKIKLVKYFQSKKSNGGDCEVDYKNGSRTAVLRFRKEEDQQNVLGKETHQISLDKGVLKMTVRLLPDEKTAPEAPSDKLNKKSDVAVHNKQSSAEELKPAPEVQTEAKGGDDDAADEEPCSTSAVIGNIPETLSQEFLEMLVENVLKNLDSPSAPPGFTLEIIPGISSAVVTFQSGKENTDFVTRCPQNRMFTNKGLSVRPLEVTEQVAIEDIGGLNEDLLQLYFENEVGNVENVTLNEVEECAIITFKDHKAVQKIMKKKHCIKKKEIRVYPLYKSLGTALYGEDKPSVKLPAAISEPMDNVVWRYLKDNQSAAETIHSDLAKHFCKVNLSQPTVSLSPVSSLLQLKDAKAIIKAWKDTVSSAFAQAVSKFKSLKFPLESEVWEETEENIRQMLKNEDVVIVTDKASGVLSVVGLVGDVNRLEQTLPEVVNKIVKRIQREKACITQVIQVSPSMFYILCQDGLQDKLLQVYPELKMSFRKDSPDLTVTGLSEEILAARKVIFDAMFALKQRKLELDNFVLDLLKDEDPEELTNALLTSKGINAAFEINAQRVQLFAASDRDLNDAEDHLRNLLMSQHVDVEDSNVLKKPEWQQLVSQLEDANSKSCRRLKIHATGQQVVVSGHKDSVIKVSHELDDFLSQNAQIEETVVVKPNTIVEYIKKINTSCMQVVEDKVEVSYRKEAICLCGSRVDVTDCKNLVEDLVSTVFFESLNISKPGVKKFFKDKETMYVSSLWSETHCLVQLVDETSGGHVDLGQRQGPKPVYQLQTSDGVEIAVCKADMCSYPVNAVVNASNQDLEHNGGLAGALLSAAGPQLQVECDQIINSRGQLKPGDCVITNAGGKLCCKYVIHAVGPKFDPAKTSKVLAQLKKAVKGSLELAEQRSCISVALPAISRSQGFNLSLCAVTIVKAVKEYCDEKYDDSTLKKIHLVNNDDTVVKAMDAAVRQEFGNHGVSHSQQTPHTKATKSPFLKHVASAGSDPNCLGQVKTKEGLEIILTKGNIENAKTEVTVNTVFEDLALNRGAVSSAILGVAGPKLQQLVTAQKASANLGEVIVTDGCKLKSKQVFHAVAPHWDKGQGTSEKTLSSIFKDCLEKVEAAGLASISFPAIGTGNLGDAQTIQVFSDEFKKMYPNASGAPVSTSSPQSTGPFSKVVSGSGMYETKMGAVAIQVVTGDITKETVDVIVNSSNETFSLKSGVSKAILDAAGQAVEAECQTLGAQPKSDMITTQPGNLKCKKILHLVGQTDPIKINKVVKDALQMCVTNSYTSVSFPAIGTVIFQTPMLKDFYNSMQQREQGDVTDPKEKSEFWGNIGTKIKTFFGSGGTSKPQKEGDFVIEPLKVDPACFHICSDSQANMDSAKQWINDLIAKELNTFTIPDNAILSLSDADHQRIVDIQKTMGISIKTESKMAQASFTIEGFSARMCSKPHH